VILVVNDEGRCGVPETVRRLQQGAAALDALEAGIRLVEADPTVRTVGYNSWPNILGEAELDAAVMDGTTLRTGAVGALAGFHHPISVARQVLERLPHEILVGAGAARFAAEIAAERIDNVTASSRAAWQRVIEAHASKVLRDDWEHAPLAELCQRATDPQLQKGTTVYLAQDAGGGLASGVSTSGWAWKYPGRLGDSPIIGAGSYADTAYGAAACTHTGEMTIRACTARSVVLYMKMGMTVQQAVVEAIGDLRRLRGGLLQGVAVHAIDARGNFSVATTGDIDADYWVWTPELATPERRHATRVP
jgi:L-asparaginase